MCLVESPMLLSFETESQRHRRAWHTRPIQMDDLDILAMNLLTLMFSSSQRKHLLEHLKEISGHLLKKGKIITDANRQTALRNPK